MNAACFQGHQDTQIHGWKQIKTNHKACEKDFLRILAVRIKISCNFVAERATNRVKAMGKLSGGA